MTPIQQRAWDHRIHALNQIGVAMPVRAELAGAADGRALTRAARLDEPNRES